MATEFAPYKGQAVHEHPFGSFFKQSRSMSTAFIPSIVTMKGGLHITDDMFKPKTIPRPMTAKERARAKEIAEDEADNSDNTVVRAYKKQQ